MLRRPDMYLPVYVRVRVRVRIRVRIRVTVKSTGTVTVLGGRDSYLLRDQGWV